MQWKDSKKDTNGWAYESDVAQDIMKAMVTLAYELNQRKKRPQYEKIFNEITSQIIELLN